MICSAPAACEHAERAPSAFDAHHARAVQLRRGRIAFEHQFDPAIGFAQVVEGAFENCASPVDDHHVIGDLLDFSDLVGGEKHRRAFVGDVADQRLQHLLGRHRIKPGGGLIQDEQLCAAAAAAVLLGDLAAVGA